MSSIVLKNARFVDFDPPRVSSGPIRIKDGRIDQVGEGADVAPAGQTVDCRGGVVMPGLVDGHTHLCAALARGMPPPDQPAQNFQERLEREVWRYDAAMTEQSVERAALIAGLEALHCGTTTVFDHHSSPGCIPGSLQRIEDALDRLGMRGILSYEVSDRIGPDARDQSLAENERHIDKTLREPNGRFAGLVGAHALFTLEDQTLNDLRGLCRDLDVGLHMHLAEDVCDEEICGADHQLFLLDRLGAHKLLLPGNVFAHGTHLRDEEVAPLVRNECTISHNPTSNMHTGVGYARIGRLAGALPVMLGTDGRGGDLLAEARTAYLKACDEGPALSPAAVLGMLATAARRASAALDTPLGKLEPAHAADLVITDYVPATPLTDDNVAQHVLMGVASRHVRDVMIGGCWRLRDRTPVDVDESAERTAAVQEAAEIWRRL